MKRTDYLSLCIVYILKFQLGNTCTYPADWYTYTVVDSVEGVLNITPTTISGWSETSFGDTYSEWKCYQTIGSNIIISRSVRGDILNTNTFDDSYSYLCMEITKVNDTLYNYKLLSAQDSNSANSRLILIAASTTPNFPTDCNGDNNNDIRTLTIVGLTLSTDSTASSTTVQGTTTNSASVPLKLMIETVIASILLFMIFKLL